VQENMPSPEQIKLAFASKIKKGTEYIDTTDTAMKEEIPFLQLFDEFVKECGAQNNWAASTCKKFSNAKKHLTDFDAYISFDKIDETTLNAYIEFLRNKNLCNVTIAKQINFLKWFLRWTVKKGYNTHTAFSTFNPKLKSMQKKVIFLTWEELTQLKEYKVPEQKKYLERVRDVFVFCCFTGLRYSDVCNLKRSDIKNNHIEITTVKTADSLMIELNNHSKAILDKYKEIPFEKDRVLPVVSNQKMNEYIKELGELAGINEPVRETYYKGNKRIDEVTPKYALLGTHAGRRTFICNALSLCIPANVVMKWTGHSDYTAMKPYIDIADKIKANEMEKFNRL
jgi:integrase